MPDVNDNSSVFTAVDVDKGVTGTLPYSLDDSLDMQ